MIEVLASKQQNRMCVLSLVSCYDRSTSGYSAIVFDNHDSLRNMEVLCQNIRHGQWNHGKLAAYEAI